MSVGFKIKNSLQERWTESLRVIAKYPDRIPVICERSNKATKDCPIIDKNKYLVPRDLTVGQFIFVIRNRLKLPAEKAIFLFIGGMIPSTSSFINNLYETHRDEDGFLYITYSFENTFG